MVAFVLDMVGRRAEENENNAGKEQKEHSMHVKHPAGAGRMPQTSPPYEPVGRHGACADGAHKKRCEVAI